MCTDNKQNGGEIMKRVIIELNEEIHKQLKIYCFKKGVTLKSYITGLVIKDLKDKKEQTQ